MQHNSYRRWITLAIISFSGGVSFDLAYLRYIYQIPMAKFMGFSNTEIGLRKVRISRSFLPKLTR